MSNIKKFPKGEYELLLFLKENKENISVQEVAEKLKMDQTFIAAAVKVLSEKGFVKVKEEHYIELFLKEEGKIYTKEPLPERRVLNALEKVGGESEIKDIPQVTGISQQEVGNSLKWLLSKKWVSKEGSKLKITEIGKKSLTTELEDEKLIKHLGQVGIEKLDNLQHVGINGEEAIKLLKGRDEIVSSKKRVIKFVELTPLGEELLRQGIERKIEVTQLTSELILSGKWREVDFQKYDVTMSVIPTYPGKIHPFRKIEEETKKVFFEMGFTEIVSPYVESSFWDFDALFVPQDHPAREMQDTFYTSNPAKVNLPKNEKLIENVRKTHEDGGDTGSIGWRYKWDIEKSTKPLLRTHTTSSTIRALANNPKGPGKYFCIGAVFRRETIDYKHLPIFHQVDGIIVEKGASFAHLLGTLSEFYKKMGFSKFQFRPAFFPYTEPSVEVYVWNDKKGDWVEMGGAGIFRPEVTLPLGCTDNVLAWGLGLEHIVMFRYNLSDIREIYMANIKWLKEAKLCL